MGWPRCWRWARAAPGSARGSWRRPRRRSIRNIASGCWRPTRLRPCTPACSTWGGAMRRTGCCAIRRSRPGRLAPGRAEHGGEAGEVGGLDLACDLEAEALVERRVLRVGAFQVGKPALGVDEDVEAVGQERRAQAAALPGRVDADHRQVPV